MIGNLESGIGFPYNRPLPMPTLVATELSIERELKRTAAQVDKALDRWLPRPDALPRRLHEAIRYAVFGGGKRLRPAVAIWTCEALGGEVADVLPAACALEMIHTYSLVHDDLPAMDDDDFRRGRPSCHKAFDEATAMLVGDGLQAAAFETLAVHTPDASIVPALVLNLARAAGTRGMVGGQQLDLDGDASATREILEQIHRMKTAAMFVASSRMGAIAARASDDALERHTVYGRSLGLAFQIVDDILDVCGTAEQLGKTPGKDARQRKATYPALYGLEASRREARRLIADAIRAIRPPGRKGAKLRQLAEFILARTH